MADWVGPKTPVIGPWMGKFGRVVDIMATPCDVEPEIWVQAFFAGLPMAIVSLTKPDPFDMVSERFNLGHKKKRKRRFRMAGNLELKNYQKGSLGWAVFKVGAWAERVGWYMLVIDVGFEWAVTWSSTAYEWSGCPDPNASWGWNLSEGHGPWINEGYWAGWGHTAYHGYIATDEFGPFLRTQMRASPYIDLEMSRPNPGFPPCHFFEVEVVNLTTGWRSPPFQPNMNDGQWPKRHTMVYKDYLGSPSLDHYAAYIRSDGGWTHHRLKLGLNGTHDRGLAFDP